MTAEWATIALRTLVYVGSIAAAGAVLFSASFPRAATAIRPALRWQIAAGAVLLLIVEPLRYLIFQLAIADGDWGLAFSPDMRWMAFMTPIGHAALVRLAAALVILVAGERFTPLRLAAAVLLIGSFLIEGHTAASDARLMLAPLLFVHLAAVHWWIGALLPLLVLTQRAPHDLAMETMHNFGRRALWVVAALVAAGGLLAIALTGGVLQLDNAYQRRLLIKLALVAAILAVAGINKLRLTPLLQRDHALGSVRLRRSIAVEMALALAILMATAWLIAVGPEADGG